MRGSGPARRTLDPLFPVSQRGLADLGLGAVDFLLVQDLHALSLADGAGGPAGRRNLADAFTAVCLGQMVLPRPYSAFASALALVVTIRSCLKRTVIIF